MHTYWVCLPFNGTIHNKCDDEKSLHVLQWIQLWIRKVKSLTPYALGTLKETFDHHISSFFFFLSSDVPQSFSYDDQLLKNKLHDHFNLSSLWRILTRCLQVLPSQTVHNHHFDPYGGGRQSFDRYHQLLVSIQPFTAPTAVQSIHQTGRQPTTQEQPSPLEIHHQQSHQYGGAGPRNSFS